MTANNRDQYQGLLIPDARLRQPGALWTAESSYSEASPRPGRAVPSRDTEALLLASGAQSSVTALDILAVDGGPVGRDPRAAGLAWKNTTDGANLYRGREIPATLTAWEVVDWRTGAGIVNPDVVTLTQHKYRDQIVMVGQEEPNANIVCWTRATDGTRSAKTTIYNGLANGRGLHPCLVEVGDRLFCLHYARGVGSASNDYYIRVQMSLDGGATWEAVRARASIKTNIKDTIAFSGVAGPGLEPRGLRAAYQNGQVLVMGHLWEQAATGALYRADVLIQWASANLATKLERVQIVNASAAAPEGGRLDLAVAGGYFVMLMAGADDLLYSSRVASAYEKLSAGLTLVGVSNVTQVAGTAPSRQEDADVALVRDDVGILWAYVRLAKTGQADSQRTIVMYSDDDGAKFANVGSSDLSPFSGPSSIWNLGRAGAAHDTSAYPRGFAACWQRGRAVMAHGWHASTGTNDQSLALAYLGGYHDLTIAPIRDAAELIDRHPWQRTLLPIERAQDSAAWTGSTTGTTANVLQANGSELLTSGNGGSAGLLNVTTTEGTTGDTLMVATFAAYGSNTAASPTADRAAFTFRVDDGTRGIELGIYLGSTGFGIYDRVSGVQKALLTSLPNEVREWRLGVYSDEAATIFRCRVWYRSWAGTTPGEDDRLWNFVGAYGLSDDGGTVGTNRVQMGCFTSTAAQADLAVYHGPHFTVGDTTTSTCLAGSAYTWDLWAAATDNPDHLSLTPMSSLPVYLDGGVSVRGVDGPAMASDSWTLSAAHEYPIERVWPSYSRSPRVRWRSTDETEQKIAVALDPKLLGTDESHAGSPVYGLFLGGINWQTGEIQTYTGGAWAKVADIDASDALGVIAYTRDGASLLPNADTTKQIAGSELVGWDVRTTSPVVVRRVKANRGGRWATGATAGPRARVHLDGVDGTEPASGTMSISARDVVVLFQIPAADTTAGWRVVVDAQDTVEGFFEIGSMMLGPVWVAGQANDWGRRLTQQLGAIYRRRQDGSVSMSNPRPSGSAVEVAWPQGVDSTQWHDGTAEPTYITTTTTAGVEGAATLAGTIYDLQHELAALDGEPVVYLPRIPRSDGSGDVVTLTRWYEMLYAHVSDGLRITAPLGEEGATEKQTVAAMRLEPEL
jgi:hypothetical protein